MEKFLRLVKDNGGGYTRYVWEKPSSGQPSEKISYVIEYKPWKWIIGTGVYLDDMAGMFDLFKSRLNGFTKKQSDFKFDAINTYLIHILVYF